jgi:3-oxoadipate enol-lactonase
VPPVPLPPARTVTVPDRGEMFLRDTGGDGPPVLLLHGWMATADLNWCRAYGDLSEAGYRVLAPDHRGHGRGIRPLTPFRLADCAADAAGLLRELDAAPATVVGYSMGGAIAQLVAREHPDVVSGLICSATWTKLDEPRMRRFLGSMAALRASLTLAPYATWRRGIAYVGIRDSTASAWLTSELLRASPRDVTEAGREIGRFDSRPWTGSLPMPSVVVLTTKDTAVPPHKQRELATGLGAQVVEAPIDHLQVTSRPDLYNPSLLEALELVGAREAVKTG